MSRKEQFIFTTKDIVEIAIFVAIAFILDLPFLKFRIGQNGGSISLSMLPLFIIALRKGWFKSFIACGIVYGLLTCLFDGYGFVTYPFDYLLGFGSISVASFYRLLIINKDYKFKIKGVVFILLAVISAFVIRTLASTISGMIIYKLDFIGSLTYNLTYLLPSFAAVFALLVILYKPLLNIEKRQSYF